MLPHLAHACPTEPWRSPVPPGALRALGVLLDDVLQRSGAMAATERRSLVRHVLPFRQRKRAAQRVQAPARPIVSYSSLPAIARLRASDGGSSPAVISRRAPSCSLCSVVRGLFRVASHLVGIPDRCSDVPRPCLLGQISRTRRALACLATRGLQLPAARSPRGNGRQSAGTILLSADDFREKMKQYWMAVRKPTASVPRPFR